MKMKLPILIMGIFVVLTFSACQSSNSPQDEISRTLGIDMNDGTIGINNDSHGGFHGDGISFMSISFPDDSIVEEISANNDWKTLPLSENLTALVYGTATENKWTGPYLTDEEGESVFPEIQNGYYCFIDRHTESTDKHDDTNVFERHSFNFTIAIYDTDTDTLYYAELDT